MFFRNIRLSGSHRSDQSHRLNLGGIVVCAILTASSVALSPIHPVGLGPVDERSVISPRAGFDLVTVSGRVIDQSTGKGLPRVEVQILDANGSVVKTTTTNASGIYRFQVRDGAYVVREILSNRYTQVSPTFITRAPTGDFVPGHGASSFGYATDNGDPTRGPVGPLSWATIAPAGSLPFESPINLTGPTIDLGRYLSIDYANTPPREILNNGQQIQVQFPTASTSGTMTLGGVPYTLSQFHFHDTSENVVDGQAYPMEAHFVNISASGSQTVLAVFLRLGAHNDALDPILNAATASLTGANTSTTMTTPIDFAGLMPTSMQGWFYRGTLTTPPLSRAINWLVFSTPITLDDAQLKQYEAVASASGFLPNNRPVQPTDGRQLNEFNYDVNVAGRAVTGLDFTVAPTNSRNGRG